MRSDEARPFLQLSKPPAFSLPQPSSPSSKGKARASQRQIVDLTDDREEDAAESQVAEGVLFVHILCKCSYDGLR